MSKGVLRILCFCMLAFCITVPDVLGENVIRVSPRFSHIMTVSVYNDIVNGVVNYGGDALPIYDDTRAYITVKLQKRPVSGGSWVNVASNTVRGDYGDFAIYDGSRTAEVNYEYRVLIICTIFDSSGNALETYSRYSDIERA